MVATEAWSRATCDSSAIVTLSRKRRCTRVLIVRRNHVAAADTARPTAATRTSPGEWSITPFPRSMSHRASSASGSAASWDSTNAASISRGSWRYPSLHNRHIDESAGGSASAARSGEDVIRGPLLFACDVEALGLQVEHRAIAAVQCHQLVVRAELDDTALLEHADAIGVP